MTLQPPFLVPAGSPFPWSVLLLLWVPGFSTFPWSDSTLGDLSLCGAPVTARPRHTLSMEIPGVSRQLQTPFLKDISCVSHVRQPRVGTSVPR